MDELLERYRRLEVARLTPFGRGAIACVGVRGDGSQKLLLERLRRTDGSQITEFDLGRPYFGLFRFDEIGGVSDEVVVRFLGGDAFEIDGHGGEVASARLLGYFVSVGAALVSADEWERVVLAKEVCNSKDAFDKKINSNVERLFYSAADELVANATTERIAKIAVAQRCAWRDFFDELDCELQARTPNREWCLAVLNAAIDRAKWGRFLLEPIVVALLGEPNVGKSSLLNAILGFERAVVSPFAGTTRDLVSASIVIDGWNFKLIDAAGVRETDDEIERAGTALATRNVMSGDLVLTIYDCGKSRERQDWGFRKFLGNGDLHKKRLNVLNKIDLGKNEWNQTWILHDDPELIGVSAKTLDGIDRLTNKLVSVALAEYASVDGGVAVWNDEQTAFLKLLRDLCMQARFEEILRATRR